MGAGVIHRHPSREQSMEKSQKYYVVAKGIKPGIYTTWFGPGGAEELVRGITGALYKKFASLSEAQRWLENPISSVAASGNTAPLTGSATRKPRLVGGYKGRKKKQASSLPGSPALWAESFTLPLSSITPGKIIVYTDGGCRGNPGPGGYGVIIIAGEARIELAEGFRLTTNNRMEMMACLAALKALKTPADVILHSDSRYVINGINKGWASKWRVNNWMRTKNEAAENSDLWAQLLDLCDSHRVQFVWIHGHAGQTENERCDRLAAEASEGPDLQQDRAYVEGRTRIPG
jgi:ribonuclease HI